MITHKQGLSFKYDDYSIADGYVLHTTHVSAIREQYVEMVGLTVECDGTILQWLVLSRRQFTRIVYWWVRSHSVLRQKVLMAGFG